MDFKKLIPDFNALGKTDWTKPQVDTKDVIGLATLAAAVLMLVFVFCPWFGMWNDQENDGIARLGITLWYGVLGFIFALVAVGGTLYRQHALTFCASVLCLVMGLLGMVCWASLKENGVEFDGEQLKQLVELGKAFGAKISIVRWGAILYFVCALVTAAGSFMAATGCKLGECKK